MQAKARGNNIRGSTVHRVSDTREAYMWAVLSILHKSSWAQANTKVHKQKLEETIHAAVQYTAAPTHERHIHSRMMTMQDVLTSTTVHLCVNLASRSTLAKWN